ncbi:unnamed protein product [Symbiodinium natans]|uniref:Uncharacterized protein n=1 Tax=Symbiodinium natans TaxID=878477 RepID=A0A812RSL6_9DINO|nr:unnamed protein product [Symbiodinium natans]
MIASRSGGFLAFLNRSRQKYEEALRAQRAHEEIEEDEASEEATPTELPLPESAEEASDRHHVEEEFDREGEPLVHAAEQVPSADAEQSGNEEDQAIADLPEDAQGEPLVHAAEQVPYADAEQSGNEEDQAIADLPEDTQGEPLVHAAEQVSSADAEQSGTEEDQAIADLPEDAQVEVLGPTLADPEQFDDEDSVEAEGVPLENVKAHLAKRRKRLEAQLFAVPGRRRRKVADSWPKGSETTADRKEGKDLKQEVPIKHEEARPPAVKRELSGFPSERGEEDAHSTLLKRRRQGDAKREVGDDGSEGRSEASDVVGPAGAAGGRMMRGLPHADLLRLAGQLEHRYLGASEWQSMAVAA